MNATSLGGTDGSTSEPSTSLEREGRGAYTQALISEIRLLVRAISNDPIKRLANLRLAYTFPGQDRPQDLSSAQILNRVSEIEKDRALQSQIDSLAFLQMVRDAVVALTSPATGLTTAYTTLVAGGLRRDDTESSFALAENAYGLLRARARWHRWVISALTAVAIVITGVAAWEATQAALGKSLLQNLDLLRSQQATIAAEKLKLETSLDKSISEEDLLHLVRDGGGVPLSLVPLCDRYSARHNAILAVLGAPDGERKDPLPKDASGTPLRLQGSPAERELCGRDIVVGENIRIVHDRIRQYQIFWPEMAGGVFEYFGRLMEAVRPAGWPSRLEQMGCQSSSEKSPTCDDSEFVVVSSLQITTNYSLPLVFGFLGSLVYVLLDHYTKLRASTLSPRDYSLMPLRLILGLVIAACVSLLVSSYAGPNAPPQATATGLPPAGSLVASLTLSASGLGFLAGFGAEAVFTMLQAMVDRIFATQK